MTNDWIAYHPERIEVLRARVRQAIDDLRSLRSDDPVAADATHHVGVALAHLESDWLPLIERIRHSEALGSPFGGPSPNGPLIHADGETARLSVAEAEAVEAFMGSGRLDLTPNAPDPPVDASREQLAVHRLMYGPWAPAIGAKEALSDAFELSRDVGRVLVFDDRECAGEAARMQACAVQVAGILPWGRATRLIRWLDEGLQASSQIGSSIGPKIAGQMERRGWSNDLIADTIANPHRTVVTRDTRYLSSGTRMDEPATAYLRSDGSYVVRNDSTGDIVQVSDRHDPEWKAPWD